MSAWWHRFKRMIECLRFGHDWRRSKNTSYTTNNGLTWEECEYCFRCGEPR